jgi:hypothetical protein
MSNPYASGFWRVQHQRTGELAALCLCPLRALAAADALGEEWIVLSPWGSL